MRFLTFLRYLPANITPSLEQRHREGHMFSWKSIVEKRLELYEEVQEVTPLSLIHRVFAGILLWKI